MKVRWRQHEITLVVAVTVITLAAYLWDIFYVSTDQYGNPFIESNTPFSLYKNVVLPDVGRGLSALLAYLWINLYTIPRLLFPRKVEAGMSKISLSFSKISLQGMAKKILGQYLWLFVQAAVIVLVLGAINNIATYYQHRWLFNYPGFSIFYNSNNPKSQLDIGGGFFAVASSVGLYGIYLGLREFAINTISNSKQREYNILICNKVTAFALQFITGLLFLKAFNIVHERESLVSVILVFSSVFAMYISNVYWLFPKKGEDDFFSRKIIVPLLSISFVYAIPLIVFIHESWLIAFLYSWALQLLVVTPVTWWYYQNNKEKILQLRVVETELVKSKADLQFLRSQINPHFLFNVLNTLYGTALQENAERTAEGIQKLGDMMRFMLHENNLDFIKMNKEIEYLKNYIGLQKLRTQSSPDIIIEDNISEQNCNHKIAPMLLIPLVENAFKHGISLKEKSWIKIHLECTESDIRFEVRNSVHQKEENDPERDRSGIGYKNVLERLKLIYGGRFQVSVNKDDKEFFVKLAIQPAN